MPHDDLQHAHLDLLLQLDRLLTEADRARVLRDNLLAAARQGLRRLTPQDAPRLAGLAADEEAAHA